MLNNANYQNYANQNYNEIPPHIGQSDNHLKVYKYKCWRGCREKDQASCTAGAANMETVWRFLKKFKKNRAAI